VVEDEDEVRAIAAMFLRSLGYGVVAVANAAEALERLRRDASIALLFSDVMLGPGMNGRELANAARELRPELPVLLTSGYEDAPDDGRHELLRKPYRREDLAAALHRNLRGRSAGHQ
jgi:CheY-like chemotaxis protein